MPVSQSSSRNEPFDPTDVLDVLGDDTCRTVIGVLDDTPTPMTATQLSEGCAIPVSTVYRTLTRLERANLAAAIPHIRPDGHHTKRYELTFDSVTISREDDGSLLVDVECSASPLLGNN